MRASILILIASFSIITITSCNSEASSPSKNTTKSIETKPKKKHGLVETFRDDGSPIAKINYNNGIKNGEATQYYEDGNPKMIITYVNGKKEGIVKWYYENGDLYMESPYLNNEKDGIEKRYFKGGVLQAEIPYREGQLCVGTKEYNSKGNPIIQKHTMQIEVKNTVALNGKLSIKAYMPKVNDVEFYFSDTFIDGGCLSEFAGFGTKVPDGVFMDELVIPEGVSFMGKLTLFAMYKSYRKIPHLVKGEKNIAVDNY